MTDKRYDLENQIIGRIYKSNLENLRLISDLEIIVNPDLNGFALGKVGEYNPYIETSIEALSKTNYINDLLNEKLGFKLFNIPKSTIQFNESNMYIGIEGVSSKYIKLKATHIYGLSNRKVKISHEKFINGKWKNVKCIELDENFYEAEFSDLDKYTNAVFDTASSFIKYCIDNNMSFHGLIDIDCILDALCFSNFK